MGHIKRYLNAAPVSVVLDLNQTQATKTNPLASSILGQSPSGVIAELK